MSSRMAQLAARTAVPTLLAFHGETIVHWPGGDETAAVEITAIVDRSEQTAEIADLKDQSGERVPVFVELTMAATIEVTTYQARREQCSVFIVDDKAWHAERVIGTDRGSGLQRVIAVRKQGVTTKRTRG